MSYTLDNCTNKQFTGPQYLLKLFCLLREFFLVVKSSSVTPNHLEYYGLIFSFHTAAAQAISILLCMKFIMRQGERTGEYTLDVLRFAR